jgi:transcriptional regulator with XRE-family HTH domain
MEVGGIETTKGAETMNFADKLWALRGQAGLSEAALAKKSGVPLGTLHGYGLGLRLPTLAAAAALAEALGVSCADFARCDDIRAVYAAGGEADDQGGRPGKGKPPPREVVSRRRRKGDAS